MRARRGALAVVVALLAPIGVVATTAAPSGAALPACTTTWVEPEGGSWDTAASWSGGTVPTVDDHVCITAAGTYTVTVADPGDPVTVASLRVGAADGTTTQTLAISRGVDTEVEDSLYATDGIDIGSRGVVELGESTTAGVSLGSCSCAGITNAGTIRQASGSTEVQSIWADVVNTGLLQLDHPLVIEGHLTNDGDGVIRADHVLHVRGVMWTKGGSVRGEGLVAVYDELRVGEGDTDRASGAPAFTLDGREGGGELSIEADSPIDISVYGFVFVSGDSHPGQDIGVNAGEDEPGALVFEGTWTNGGYVDLEPGDAVEAVVAGFEDGATLVNEGELERFSAEGGDTVVAANLVNRGSIDTRDGVIEVVGDVENEGHADLGLGRLVVLGDVALDPSSAVTIAVDGDGGPERLAAVGDVHVDGRLDVATDTAPLVDTAVTVVRGATRTGTFDEVRFAGSASYDDQYTDTQVDLVRRASESATRRFVRAAFQDFLGRQPTASELAQRSAAIDGATLTRATLLRQLSLSDEYVTTLVQRFYADTLDRPGDPGGVDFWVTQLRTGRWTVAEVAGSFYASDEYFDRAGGTNTAWVTDLYDVFFDRPPAPDDLTYWTNRIATKGRTRVAIELYQSLESRRQRVERLYHDLLGRPGEADGIDFWAGRITALGDLVLAVHLAASPEYLDRAQTRYP